MTYFKLRGEEGNEDKFCDRFLKSKLMTKLCEINRHSHKIRCIEFYNIHRFNLVIMKLTLITKQKN